MKRDRSDQKRRKSERTSDRITEAFVAICGEKGTRAATVAEIARGAGIDRATFYRHFEDKTDLMERGVERLLASVFREIDESPPPHADPAGRILARMTRFFEIAREREELFRNLASGSAGPMLSKKTEDFVVRFLKERRLGAIERQELTLPLSLASRALASLLFGFTSWWLDHPRSYTARQMAARCLESSRGFFRSPPRRP